MLAATSVFGDADRADEANTPDDFNYNARDVAAERVTGDWSAVLTDLWRSRVLDLEVTR